MLKEYKSLIKIQSCMSKQEKEKFQEAIVE